jgi:hypothetical protein
MEINSCRSLGEEFSLNPAEYENVPITGLDFSVRVSNRLQRDNIRTVAELLNTTVEHLMGLSGLGKNCLDEIARTLSQLPDMLFQTTLAENLPTGSILPLIYANKEAVVLGDFSPFDILALSDADRKVLDVYKEAFTILGDELAFECYTDARKILPLSIMLQEFCQTAEMQKELRDIISKLPIYRRNARAIGYINAFTLKEEERTTLKSFLASEDASLASLSQLDEISPTERHLLVRFLSWCNFDLTAEIEGIFNKIYANEKLKLVIQMRTAGNTLEQIGSVLMVTRERVRQLEVKAKRMFSRYQSRIRIISKISAERNGDTVITPIEIKDYCQSKHNELLFLLRSSESVNFIYDKALDVFIVGDDSLSSRVQAYVETLPDIIGTSQLPALLSAASEDEDIPEEMLERCIKESYRVTGEVYHRTRLSLASIYTSIIGEFYPDGIHAYDDNEIARFRQLVFERYGDVKLPENNRALTARIAGICILCDRGTYRLKQKQYISRKLANRIDRYMEDSEFPIFLTNTLYSVFEAELNAEGVTNKYYLQGILHELFGNKYNFSRDYISKDSEITSVYSTIVTFIEGFAHPVTRQQIQSSFPGVPEIVISFAVEDPEILNYFGSYLHASHLSVSNDEKQYLESTIAQIVSDNGTHHIKDITQIIMRDKPEILTRNAALFPFSAYSLIEYLFRSKFQFSRPYVAKIGVEIDRPADRLHDAIYSEETYTVAQISDFCKESHYQIQSMLEYLNSCNDQFLMTDTETIVLISKTGITEEIVDVLESAILTELTETTPVLNLLCWQQFPAIQIPWTEWLVYSAINKWGKQLSVSTSNNQLRLAIPLVAPKGQMDESKFRGMSKDAVSSQPICADNLDNIDDLIADIIDLDEEWEG